MRLEDGKLYVESREVFILQVGVGGTGSHVLLSLSKVIRGFQVAHIPRSIRYLIADGAVVKEHNMENQHFLPRDVGQKKAAVLARRYQSHLNISLMSYLDYLESTEALWNLVEKINQDRSKPLILLGCVDNNRTRQVLHRFFCDYEGQLIYIDAGNHQMSGQVVLGARTEEGILIPSVCEFYPSMLTDEDMFKSEESCQENYVRFPQLQITNEKAADAMVNLVHNIIRFQQTRVFQITFNIEDVVQRPWYIEDIPGLLEQNRLITELEKEDEHDGDAVS